VFRSLHIHEAAGEDYRAGKRYKPVYDVLMFPVADQTSCRVDFRRCLFSFSPRPGDLRGLEPECLLFSQGTSIVQKQKRPKSC